MEMIHKNISKTVQKRQLKRLRPQHYEIITRYLSGQKLWKISSDMGISLPWLSVVINSPLVQREIESRQWEREQAILEKITEREIRLLDGLEQTMRTGIEPPTLKGDREFFKRLDKLSKPRKQPTPKLGLGELVIKSMPRKAAPWMEDSSGREEAGNLPIEPREPVLDTPKKVPVLPLENLPSIPTSYLQCARFYSQTLRDWLWLALPYPGERIPYYEANQILRLTRGTPWKRYPEPFSPPDGHPSYTAGDISQLRGKSLEELIAFHTFKKAKIG